MSSNTARTLCLFIQNEADVARGAAILRGEEALEEGVKVLQFSIVDDDCSNIYLYRYLYRHHAIRDYAKEVVGDKGDRAVEMVLAEAIKLTRCSIQVRFAWCNLSESAVTALVDALQANEHRVKFECLENPCSYDSEGLFDETLPVNVRLALATRDSSNLLQRRTLISNVGEKLKEYVDSFPDLPDDVQSTLYVCWHRSLGLEYSRAVVDVPPAVWKQGPAAIERFFEVVNGGGSDPTSRLSVLVVGRQSIGKTSMIESIKADCKGRPVPEGKTRDTIGVERHFITENKDVPSELIVLDFGGQEDYYASHTLFHRSGGLAVVAFDLSTYSAQSFESDVYFFVQKLNASWPGVKFILVGTKSDLLSDSEVRSRCQDVLERLKKAEAEVLESIAAESRLRDVDPVRKAELAFLASSRPVLLRDHVLAVSSKTRRKWLVFGEELDATGIRELIQELHLICKTVGETLPMAYVALRDILRRIRKTRRYAPLAEVIQLGLKVKGLSEDSDVIQALQVLHDINSILWFGKDARLHSTVFLDPAFVMDVIKPLVRHDLIASKEGGHAALDQFLRDDDKLLKQTRSTLRQGGMISLEVIRKSFPVWSKIEEAIFENCLVLMEVFQIGFVVADGASQRSLLMPSHVGVNTLSPMTDSGSEMDTPSGTTLRLHRAWEFVHFFPSGVMSSLAVSLHAIHRNQGKFFLRPNLLLSKVMYGESVIDSRVLVVRSGARSSKVRLELKIFGNVTDDVREEARLVSEKIEQYLYGFSGTLINRIAFDPNNSKNEFDFDDVRGKIASGVTTVLSEDGNTAVNVSDLLPEDLLDGQLVSAPSFRHGIPRTLPFAFSGSQYHLFLSHFQTELGDFCAGFQDRLLKYGVQSWFDQRTKEISGDSMRQGIEESDSYVLFLSTRALSRKAVRFELITAIRMEKPILLMLETRDNRAKFDFDSKSWPETVAGEDPAPLYFKKSFREMVSQLLLAEAIEIHRRDRHETVMIEQVVEIAKDTAELLRRKAVTQRLKADMGW